MIGIRVDHHVVGIPAPIGDERIVVRRHTEVEPVEPESVRTPAAQPEHMARTKATGKPAVFPRTIEMIMRVRAPGLMSEPAALVAHVHSFVLAMAWDTRRTCERRGAARRNRRMPGDVWRPVPVLSPCRSGAHYRECQDRDVQFHVGFPF